MPSVRVVACPPGEAPEAVRRAWIGLELPLASGKRSRPGAFYAAGVISGTRGRWRRWLLAVLGLRPRQIGYSVNAQDALTVLDGADPTAAAWWRDHCPHLFDGRQHLVFPADVCQERP